MDPFQVAASGVALAEISLRLYNTLSKFVTRAKDADEEANELRYTVQRSLRTLLVATETLQARSRDLNQGTPVSEEAHIWSNIHESLMSWDRNLKNFRKYIEKVPNPSQSQSSMTWIEKTMLQLKLDRKAPIIQRFQRNITEHVQELSLSLQCLNIFMQQDRDKLIADLLGELHKLAPADQEDNNITYVQASNVDRGIVRRRSRHQKTMHKCIHTAFAVVDKMSEAGSMIQAPSTIADDEQWSTDTDTEILDDGSDFEKDPTAESIPPDKIPVKDEDAGPAVEFLENAGDSEFEFDNSTPREILHALIDNYQTHTSTATHACQYDKAEEHQRRMIELAEEWNSLYEPPHNIGTLKRDLVRSLKNQGTPEKLTESENVLRHVLSNSRSALPVSPPPPRPPASPVDPATAIEQSAIYFDLAEVNYMKHQQRRSTRTLQKSANYAKQSFKLRLPFRHLPASGFQESVEFFVQILEQQGRPVDAETYRTLFLQPNTTPPTHHLFPSLPSRTPSISFEDPNGIDLNGRPYLISAIISCDLERIDLLLNHQAKPEITHADRSALMYAVDSGSAPIIAKLQTWGANMDTDPSPTATGYTALHYAITQLNPTMVDTLLSHGASIELPFQGHTPLQRAARLKSPDLISVLHRHGASINATDADGLTALHLALRGEGGADTARLLLNNGADPNMRCTEDQRTPLHYTIVDKNAGSAAVLLEQVGSSVDLEAEDSNGRTAVTLAILHNRYELVKMLLDEGAMIRWDKLPNGLPMNVERLLKKTEKDRKSAGLARTGSRASSAVDSVTSRRSSIMPWRRRTSRVSFGGT